jgi:hypothetical protein
MLYMFPCVWFYCILKFSFSVWCHIHHPLLKTLLTILVDLDIILMVISQWWVDGLWNICLYRRSTIGWYVTIWLWVVYPAKRCKELDWKLLPFFGISLPLWACALKYMCYVLISNPVNYMKFIINSTYSYLQLASADASQIIQALHAGFVPVSCCT